MTARVTLLIHLLRLRPSPQQLNTWNEDNTDYNETHVRQGWTAFLEEIAGPETIDECPKVSVEKAERRRKYLSQIYELAGMEEEYKRDDRGTNILACPLPNILTDSTRRV